MSELKIRNESRKAFFHDHRFCEFYNYAVNRRHMYINISFNMHLQNIATNINAQNLIFLLQFLTQL